MHLMDRIPLIKVSVLFRTYSVNNHKKYARESHLENRLAWIELPGAHLQGAVSPQTPADVFPITSAI